MYAQITEVSSGLAPNIWILSSIFQAGLQELAGNATMLFYMTEEGQEGRNAFNQKRQPDFSKFKRNP